MSKQINFLFICILFFVLVFPLSAVRAENSITTNVAGVTQVYPYDFDVLVLDFTVELDSAEVLDAIAVNKAGSARKGLEFDKVYFWLDDEIEGFQGMGMDTLLGEGMFYVGQYYLDDLILDLPAGENRIFVSMETVERRLTEEKNILFTLPTYNDENSDGIFQLGDSGLFFESGNIISQEVIGNTVIIKAYRGDNWGPKINVKDETVDNSDIQIKCRVRDRGDGGVKSAEVKYTLVGESDGEWQEMELLDDYKVSFDVNMAAGDYEVIFRATDNYDRVTCAEPLLITVEDSTVEPEIPEPEPEPEYIYKTPDSSSLYLIKDGERHVFPHAAVYNSWGYPTDYSTVETVAQEVLENYPAGDAVKFKDGTLFRGTAESVHGKEACAVFYVQGGALRPVISAEAYQVLFDDPNWELVVWVPDDYLSYFEYELGEMLTADSLL